MRCRRGNDILVLKVTLVALRERRLAVSRLWIRRTRVGREASGAAYGPFHLVSRRERRIRPESEALEGEEGAADLRAKKFSLFIIY